MDINIKVTGLDKLAEGLLAFASAQKEVLNVAQYQAMPEHAPAAGVPTPATPNAAPAAAPAHVPTIPASPLPAAQTGPVAAPTTPTAPTAPAAAPAYTLNDLAQPAGVWLSADPAKQAERIAAVTALNKEFGIEGLNQLAPEQYGAYALRLRTLGVGI